MIRAWRLFTAIAFSSMSIVLSRKSSNDGNLELNKIMKAIDSEHRLQAAHLLRDILESESRLEVTWINGFLV